MHVDPIRTTLSRIGEDTKKIKLAVRQEVRGAKIYYGALVGIVSLVGAGFVAHMFLGANFADATETKQQIVGAKSANADLEKRFSAHVAEESSVLSAIKSTQHNLEEDYHFERAQLWEIAKSVGARQLSAPKHSTGEAQK